MKKETIEIKVAYQAPEVNVHTVRVQQSFLSAQWGTGTAGGNGYYSEDEEELD